MNQQQWSQIAAKAWADPKIKQRLLTNPAEVLTEHGIPVPSAITVKVVENTEKLVYLTLPVRPSGELSESELQQVSGGIIAILIGAAPPARQVKGGNTAS